MNEKCQKDLITVAATLCAILLFFALASHGAKKQISVWYVEQGMEDSWVRILRQAKPPEKFIEIKTWDGCTIPTGAGILIATKPWHNEENVTFYPRLSFDLEHNGAITLALDPWMIFRKYKNPPLTYSRLFQIEGEGQLLIPESISTAVADGYDWDAALFTLMGSEPAWLYAPLSKVRHYRDPHKSLLEATPFPDKGGQTSLRATILWALPTGTDKNKEKLAKTIEWLKSPATQTIIADTLEWIPADPYGEAFDPVSLSSQRAWLTAEWVYTQR